MAQRDPFSWADDYAKTQSVRAAQESGDAQQTLMNIFAQEARRQLPMNDLLTDLAKMNKQYDLSLRNQQDMLGQRIDAKQQSAQQAKLSMPPNKIGSLITQYAKTYGVDADSMIVRAQIESNFRPTARNASGASGLWQFMPGTAKEMGLADPFDPIESTDAAMRYELQNQKILESAGIPITAGTTYLAWQQGAGGAVKLLSNPDVPAEKIVGRKAVIQNGGRPGMSAKQFANMWISKADRLYAQRKALKQRAPAGPTANQAFGQDIAVTFDNLDEEDDA